ncbi:MAG: hypothetical protein KA163_05035 [Bacteroidia bacterium]|nr:hypothetical protein [Bacteroidia bacterium]
MLIKAICDNHAVLVDGKIQVIGSMKDKKRFAENGSIVQTEIVFDFGTQYKDSFFFENQELVYMSVSMEAPEYLTAVYSKCTQERLKPLEFIEKVKESYVFKSLGF